MQPYLNRVHLEPRTVSSQGVHSMLTFFRPELCNDENNPDIPTDDNSIHEAFHIDLSSVRCQGVDWHDSTGKKNSNATLRLDMYADYSKARAFFKLSGTVFLDQNFGEDDGRGKKRGISRGQSRGSQGVNKRRLFLFIYPEHVQSIKFGSRRSRFGKNRRQFVRFSLSQPPSLVGPKEEQVTLKGTEGTSQELLAAMIALANARSFTVYISIGLSLEARDDMSALSKIFKPNQLATDTAHADLNSLYEGYRGVVLDLKNDNPAHCNSDSSCTVEVAPPPYDEADTSHRPFAKLSMYQAPSQPNATVTHRIQFPLLIRDTREKTPTR